MKYIQQYIKKHYPNVVITNSEQVNSNSKYLNVNGYHIRLSDHISPLTKHIVGTCHLEIIQPFGEKDNFIIIHTPTMKVLTKKRSDVKSFLKTSLELHSMERELEKTKIKVKTSIPFNEVIQHLTRHLDWIDISAYCGRCNLYIKCNKKQREKLKQVYINNKKLTPKQFFSFLEELPKQKRYADDTIARYINEMKKKYKLK